MSIEVSCDCAMTYRLPERYAGKRCRCRECGDSIRVPAMKAVAVAERAPAERSKKTQAKKNLKANVRMRSERMRPVSESLHQMAPLNLSESRPVEPPAARKLLKKAAEVAAQAKARKRQRVGANGPGSESELDTARPDRKAKGRHERDAAHGDDRAGKNGSKAKRDRALGRRDRHDEDATGRTADESPKKKSKKAKAKKLEAKKAKKAAKLEKKLEKGKAKKAERLEKNAKAKKSRAGDEEDSSEELDAKKKLSPREEKRRQQMRLLLGSLAGAALCLGFLIFVLVHRGNAEEAAVKRVADAKVMVKKAQETAHAQNWPVADKLYREAIAFVTNPDDPIHDDRFMQEFRRFEAEHKIFPEILAALAKLELDPAGSVEDLAKLTGYENDTIRLAGLEGLVKANDGRAVSIFKQFANSANVAERDAARRGLIQLGCAEAMPFLAPVILEHGSSNALGQAAITKALEGAAPDTKALQAILEKVTDSATLVRALKLLGSLADPASAAAVSGMTKSSDPEVARAAADALAQIKGEKP